MVPYKYLQANLFCFCLGSFCASMTPDILSDAPVIFEPRDWESPHRTPPFSEANHCKSATKEFLRGASVKFHSSESRGYTSFHLVSPGSASNWRQLRRNPISWANYESENVWDILMRVLEYKNANLGTPFHQVKESRKIQSLSVYHGVHHKLSPHLRMDLWANCRFAI